MEHAQETLIRRFHISGPVQGIGFRPMVCRLARRRRLTGQVQNHGAGVLLDVEGLREQVLTFEKDLRAQAPSARLLRQDRDGTPRPGPFAIVASQQNGNLPLIYPKDKATCAECVAEIFDQNDRRFGYPFNSCNTCGPRYSILRTLPFDRENTSMAAFPLCPDCQSEYENPEDRRFHAQTISCPACGPRLIGNIEVAIQTLLKGGVLAVRGLGGFHLVVDSASEDAVARLRQRKNRPHKPMAIMVSDLQAARELGHLTEGDGRLLLSPEAPIVLVPAKKAAPRAPLVGMMLPYTPLHHMLVKKIRNPLVVTSANVSSEPILFEENSELKGLADYVLSHNRDITHPMDDSVIRGDIILRAGRGFAPTTIPTFRAPVESVAACGSHEKNTYAHWRGREYVVSPHLGNMDSLAAQERLKSAIADAEVRVCDPHPGYGSTVVGNSLGKVRSYPHHLAHVLAVCAEHGITRDFIGVAFDGTGLGANGAIWGGEFFHEMTHSGQLRPFPLPGGDRSAREPRRIALAIAKQPPPHVLNAFSRQELKVLSSMIHTGFQTPLTSSVGRLFDGVAALLDLVQVARYEAEAPVALEALAARGVTPEDTPAMVVKGRIKERILDWQPTIDWITREIGAGRPREDLAAGFHEALCQGTIAMIKAIAPPNFKVVLAGGVFQNSLLCTRLGELLPGRILRAQKLSPGDGGLSLGQLHHFNLELGGETPCV